MGKEAGLREEKGSSLGVLEALQVEVGGGHSTENVVLRREISGRRQCQSHRLASHAWQDV